MQAASAPLASSRARSAAIGGQSSSAGAARSFSTSAASCPASPVANGSAASAATRSARARGGPVARVDLGRAERDARPGQRRPRRARRAGTARAARRARARARSRGPRRRTGRPSRPPPRARAARPARAARAASRSRAAARAPASALPPPSPAPTGACLSMCTRQPAAWPGARREQAERARDERVAAGEPGRVDARRARPARARASSPSAKRGEHRRELVVAVGAPRPDAQAEIDLDAGDHVRRRPRQRAAKASGAQRLGARARIDAGRAAARASTAARSSRQPASVSALASVLRR